MATESAAVSPSAFGPSALATPANAVTIARLLASPVLLAVIVGRDEPASWAGVGFWFVLCCTDGLDGWLARKQGATRSGAFLDPLADKVLVLGALGALVAADRFHWLPVALITARELGISLFRSYWGRRGLAVPASMGAKFKTLVQELAVGCALLPWTADASLATALLWIAVALTLVTGWQYVRAGSRATRLTGAA